MPSKGTGVCSGVEKQDCSVNTRQCTKASQTFRYSPGTRKIFKKPQSENIKGCFRNKFVLHKKTMKKNFKIWMFPSNVQQRKYGLWTG